MSGAATKAVELVYITRELLGVLKQAKVAMQQAVLVLDARERQGQATVRERFAAEALDEALQAAEEVLLYAQDDADDGGEA